MSSLIQPASDAVSQHPEVVILAFAVIVLFLAITIFLWARRAARLQSAVEELTASRDALTSLLQRPAAAGRDRGPTSVSAPREREVYSVTSRKPAAEATPASAAENQPIAAGVSPVTVVAAEPAVHGDTETAAATPTTTPPASPQVSAMWDGADEEVVPPAAAWAATAQAEPAHVQPSPFKTVSFTPLNDPPKVPTFSFSRPAEPEPEPAQAPEPEPEPAPQLAYDHWASLSRTGGDEPAPPVLPTGDPAAYAAWGEVTAAAPFPSPAHVDELVVLKGHLPTNGNEHAHDDNEHAHDGPIGRENGSHAHDGRELDEVTMLVGPAAVTSAEADSGGILLVEDDTNVAKIYRLILESKGHTVRHADDGVAALDEVRKGRPDLVLLDVMMPRMNGILFLQSLRAQPDFHDLPVVILSNFREPRLVDRAMALGALEYVVKAQTRPEVLISAVPRWLAGERAFTA